MKAIKCIVCGRDKQGAMVCYPCRCAANRLIENGFTAKEVFLVMMFSKLFPKKIDLSNNLKRR